MYPNRGRIVRGKGEGVGRRIQKNKNLNHPPFVVPDQGHPLCPTYSSGSILLAKGSRMLYSILKGQSNVKARDVSLDEEDELFVSGHFHSRKQHLR